jgi:hypothetical protein
MNEERSPRMILVTDKAKEQFNAFFKEKQDLQQSVRVFLQEGG